MIRFRTKKKQNRADDKRQHGFVMITIITFIPIVVIFSSLVVISTTQAFRTTINQELIRQAQLAAVSAMDFAKEQYELDITYMGTPEMTLYETDQHTITVEVAHIGFSNPTNTQQDIQGIGRVYKKGKSNPLYLREIQGKITYTAGSNNDVRFIFVIDNSGSMSQTEWLQSKGTVDASINYVLDNAPTAEVAVIQYGTNHYSREHKYDVTVPFTKDNVAATNWDRQFGPGSPSPSDYQDHLPGSLAQMRIDDLYGPGDALDLTGATNIQYVMFTDAVGINSSWCCSSLKKVSTEPSGWHDNNGPGYSILENYGEYDAIKDGTVFDEDGYPGLTASWTVLSINQSGSTPAVSAALASVGGSWNGAIDANPDDPEGDSILPRKFISTTLSAGPDEIISLLQEILEAEINI